MKTWFSRLLPLLFLSSTYIITPAYAAEPEPLPPAQAFPMSATAKGADTIVTEWKIADGYYLYHDKFQFRSDTPGVTLGKPRIPAGKVKHDEYFGDVETHRGNLEIEIPVERSADAGNSIHLIAKSQGCADIGICYPPYEQTATIQLAAAETASKPDGLQAVTQLGNNLGLQEEEFLPPDQAFVLTTEVVNANTVKAHWQITKGYYLYRDKFKFNLKQAPEGVKLGEVVLPPGENKHDEYFGDISVFHNEVSASIPIVGNSAGQPLNLELIYQGCAEAGLCYPPIFKTVSLDLGKTGAAEVTASRPPAANTAPAETDNKASQAKQAGEPLSDEEKLTRLFASGNLFPILSSLLGFGLLLAFTACMYPMIPIVSSIIVGQGEKITATKGFTLSLIYVEAMAITFGVIGAIFGGLGKAINVQAQFQNPWILAAFAILFVLLALSMFGFYNIQMPSAIQSRLNELSNRQRGGNLIGVALMGILSALIIGPCGGPILLATIAGAAASNSAGLGFLYMFTLANGMGLPLLAVGAGGGKLLPRAGTWMDTVKAVAGVILLAIAILLMERVLPSNIFMTLWAALFMVSAVYMGAFDSIATGASGWRRLWKGLGLVIFVYGVLILLGGLTGARNFNDPLHGSSLVGSQQVAPVISGGVQPAYVQFAQGKDTVIKGGMTFIKIKTTDDFERELAAANRAGHTVMLDFYADWCTYCKQFDDYVFSEPKVQQALSNTVLLQADITHDDAQDVALKNHVKVITAPAILFFGTDGKESRANRVLGFMKADRFLEHVNKSFQ
jgi:thiol:disulfide interchange protein DsbD